MMKSNWNKNTRTIYRDGWVGREKWGGQGCGEIDGQKKKEFVWGEEENIN